MSIGVMLFNPFTGKPRHPSDIESDPKGILVWDGEEPLRAHKPAQRQWVGLTDEEIEQGCKESWVTEQAFQSAVWWAEAKLKEKNIAAQPAVPDAIIEAGESPDYRDGWNDCRQTMLEILKARTA